MESPNAIPRNIAEYGSARRFSRRFTPYVLSAGLALFGGRQINHNAQNTSQAPDATRMSAVLPQPLEPTPIPGTITDSQPVITSQPQQEKGIELVLGEFETISRDGVTITRIFGDGDEDNDIAISFLPVGFSSHEEAIMRAQNLIKDIFSVDPMQNYINNISAWVRDPEGMPDLGCKNTAGTDWICDEIAKIREILKTKNATGIITHKTIILINSDVEGEAAQMSEPASPSIYPAAFIAMPANPSAEWMHKVAPHALGHLFGLADGYIYSEQRVENILKISGSTYARDNYNCTSHPEETWRNVPSQDNPGRAYEGCGIHKKGYYTTGVDDIMTTLGTNRFSKLNGEFIGRQIEQGPYPYQLPNLQATNFQDGEINTVITDTRLKLKLPRGTKQILLEVTQTDDPDYKVNIVFSDPSIIRQIKNDGIAFDVYQLTQGKNSLKGGKTYTLKISTSGNGNDVPAPDWSRPIKYQFWTLIDDSHSVSFGEEH